MAVAPFRVRWLQLLAHIASSRLGPVPMAAAGSGFTSCRALTWSAPGVRDACFGSQWSTVAVARVITNAVAMPARHQDQARQSGKPPALSHRTARLADAAIGNVKAQKFVVKGSLRYSAKNRIWTSSIMKRMPRRTYSTASRWPPAMRNQSGPQRLPHAEPGDAERYREQPEDHRSRGGLSPVAGGR